MVPTSTSVAPHAAMTSGMRKPPPISTSSPRETTTSRPAARAVHASSTAAAQLFTTSASSAPVSAQQGGAHGAVAVPAGAPGEVVLQRGVAQRGLAHVVEHLGAQRRAAEVGVQHDARGVDHPAEGAGGRTRRRPREARAGLARAARRGRPASSPRSSAARRPARTSRASAVTASWSRTGRSEGSAPRRWRAAPPPPGAPVARREARSRGATLAERRARGHERARGRRSARGGLTSGGVVS